MKPIELRRQRLQSTTCTCGAAIKWGTTVRGKRIALNAAAHVEDAADVLVVEADDVHWGTCPDAAQHRRPRPRTRAEKPVGVSEAGALRQLLAELLTALASPCTRNALAEQIREGLRRIDENQAGQLREDVYPQGPGRRYHGD